jgi:hypothetical protein
MDVAARVHQGEFIIAGASSWRKHHTFLQKSGMLQAVHHGGKPGGLLRVIGSRIMAN